MFNALNWFISDSPRLCGLSTGQGGSGSLGTVGSSAKTNGDDMWRGISCYARSSFDLLKSIFSPRSLRRISAVIALTATVYLTAKGLRRFARRCAPVTANSNEIEGVTCTCVTVADRLHENAETAGEIVAKLDDLDHSELVYHSHRVSGCVDVETLSRGLKNLSPALQESERCRDAVECFDMRIKPELTDVSAKSYVDKTFTLYETPYLYTCVLLYNATEGVMKDLRTWLFNTYPRLSLIGSWQELLKEKIQDPVVKALATMLPNFFPDWLKKPTIGNPVISHEYKVLLHMPTVRHALNDSMRFLRPAWENFTLRMDRQYTRQEKAYHFGRFMMAKVVSILLGNDSYQVDGTSINYYAATVLELFFSGQPGMPMPYMSIMNDVNSSRDKDMEFMRTHLPCLNDFNFQFCVAGLDARNGL